MTILLILFCARRIRPPMFVRRYVRAVHYYHCHRPGHLDTCAYSTRSRHAQCPHQKPLTAPSRRRPVRSYLNQRPHRLMPSPARSGGPRWIREPMVQRVATSRPPEVRPIWQQSIIPDVLPKWQKDVWREVLADAMNDGDLLDRHIYGAAYRYAARRAQSLGRDQTHTVDFAVWYTVNRGHSPTALHDDSLSLWYDHWRAGHPGTPGILERTS